MGDKISVPMPVELDEKWRYSPHRCNFKEVVRMEHRWRTVCNKPWMLVDEGPQGLKNLLCDLGDQKPPCQPRSGRTLGGARERAAVRTCTHLPAGSASVRYRQFITSRFQKAPEQKQYKGVDALGLLSAYYSLCNGEGGEDETAAERKLAAVFRLACLEARKAARLTEDELCLMLYAVYCGLCAAYHHHRTAHRARRPSHLAEPTPACTAHGPAGVWCFMDCLRGTRPFKVGKRCDRGSKSIFANVARIRKDKGERPGTASAPDSITLQELRHALAMLLKQPPHVGESFSFGSLEQVFEIYEAFGLPKGRRNFSDIAGKACFFPYSGPV